MKYEIWTDRFQDKILVTFPELERPQGFNIAEKCEPGAWIRSGFDPIVEMIPISHPFYGDAEEITDRVEEVLGVHPFDMVDGGQEALEQSVLKLVEHLDRELGN